MNNKSYVCGTAEVPLKGETIIKNLRKIVEKFRDNEALVCPMQNYRVTYSEFFEEIKAVAKGMLAYGIQKGDRVGIWSANRYEWVIVQYATAYIGAIMVNINPAYRAHELEYALRQSGVSLLIMSKGFRKTNYQQIIDEVQPSCVHLKQLLVLDHDWDTLKNAGIKLDDQLLASRERELSFDDPINIQYTSGTTGFPKGATLTHHNILNNGFFIGERLKYTEKDRVCIPVPFYHCFGMVLGNLACTTHGAAMVIPGEAFDPELVMKTVQEEKCTSLYGVPSMFIAELQHPNFKNYDFSTLRTGIMAGAQCPEKTMIEVIERMNMKEVQICYGMTETSPVSTQTTADDSVEKRVSTVGTIHPHLEIKLIDPETGQVVSRGEKGELCTRGYSVMLGYWNNEEATQKVIDKGRWMHTGDLAVMDEGGYVKIVGRIKDMIIRGGENIGPMEIEEYLRTHPAISDAQVIGVPSYKYGEEVCAWIKLKECEKLSNDELYTFCKGQIATYKIPVYWKFVDEFPMTVTGKIRKIEMREISTREYGLEAEACIK